MSYVICKKCGRYFEVKETYSPGDFPWKCECGGSLNYIQDQDMINTDILFI